MTKGKILRSTHIRIYIESDKTQCRPTLETKQCCTASKIWKINSVYYVTVGY